jgi:hypothetical protein
MIQKGSSRSYVETGILLELFCSLKLIEGCVVHDSVFYQFQALDEAEPPLMKIYSLGFSPLRYIEGVINF